MSRLEQNLHIRIRSVIEKATGLCALYCTYIRTRLPKNFIASLLLLPIRCSIGCTRVPLPYLGGFPRIENNRNNMRARFDFSRQIVFFS